MPRRGKPFPTWHTRNFVGLQLADAPRQVVSAGRHETRKKCDGAADRRIGWGIIRASRQVRKLEAMRVNRDIPIIGQRKGRTGMVEMSVGEDDRLGWNAGAEAGFRRFDDLLAPSGQAGIDEDPCASRSSHEKDVYETDRHPADVGRYASDRGHGGT